VFVLDKEGDGNGGKNRFEDTKRIGELFLFVLEFLYLLPGRLLLGAI
jgi:hypothetical protein